MASKVGSGKPDVVLEVDGVQFSCNRDVLASQSPYFEAMFSSRFAEKNKEIIQIQGVDASAMRVLLQWIDDASQIEPLNGDEILVLLQAAAMLQLESLQHSCEEMLVQRWLSPSSCLSTAATADQLSLTNLHHKASSMALWRFSEVRHSETFLHMSLDALVQYVSHDSLAVSEEFEVFEAVCCWVEHKMTERYSDILKALSCVRMKDVSLSDLQSMIYYSCISECPSAKDLIYCVLCIREGKEPASADLISCSIQESASVSTSGCCDNLRRLSEQRKPYTMSLELSENELCQSHPMMRDDVTIKTDEIKSHSSGKLDFTQDTLDLAQQILSRSKRQLPIVPCVIGHILRPGKPEVARNEMPNYTAARKTRFYEKNKTGTPYVFYWNAEKAMKPIPLVHLSKIDQGPVEAVGYNVVGRGEQIYVIGGEYLIGYGDWNKSVWRYNVWNETWSFETSLSGPRRHHSVACLGDDLYVIGGCGRYRVIMASVDRYNFNTKTWYKCAPLPCSLYSAATCVHKGFIYVITSQVFCYYPTTNLWVVLGEVNIPTGSSFNTAMSDGQYIYLTGLYSTNLMRFDPDGEKSIKSVGQFRNCAGNVCLVGRKIFSFSEHADCSSIEVFDIDNGTFEIMWEGNSNECRISFKKLGGCFPFVLY